MGVGVGGGGGVGGGAKGGRVGGSRVYLHWGVHGALNGSSRLQECQLHGELREMLLSHLLLSLLRPCLHQRICTYAQLVCNFAYSRLCPPLGEKTPLRTTPIITKPHLYTLRKKEVIRPQASYSSIPSKGPWKTLALPKSAILLVVRHCYVLPMGMGIVVG